MTITSIWRRIKKILFETDINAAKLALYDFWNSPKENIYENTMEKFVISSIIISVR